MRFIVWVSDLVFEVKKKKKLTVSSLATCSHIRVL